MSSGGTKRASWEMDPEETSLMSSGSTKCASHSSTDARDAMPSTAAACYTTAHEEGLVLLTSKKSSSGFSNVHIRSSGSYYATISMPKSDGTAANSYLGNFVLKEQAALAVARAQKEKNPDRTAKMASVVLAGSAAFDQLKETSNSEKLPIHLSAANPSGYKKVGVRKLVINGQLVVRYRARLAGDRSFETAEEAALENSRAMRRREEEDTAQAKKVPKPTEKKPQGPRDIRLAPDGSKLNILPKPSGRGLFATSAMASHIRDKATLGDPILKPWKDRNVDAAGCDWKTALQGLPNAM